MSNNVKWDLNIDSISGINPDIAISTETVLMCYQDSTTPDVIRYRKGVIEKDTLSTQWDKDETIGPGKNTTVALWGSMSLEFHQDNENNLYYQLGNLQNTPVFDNHLTLFGKGRNPAVAINQDYCVVIHQSVEQFELYVTLGKVDQGTISWQPSENLEAGINPTIAIYQQTLIEFHTSHLENKLYYRTGTIDNLTATWSKSHLYQPGETPSVALYGQNLLQVHRSGLDDLKNLYYRQGVSNNGSGLNFTGNSVVYGNGVHPKVATSENFAINVNSLGNRIFFQLGTYQKNDNITTNKDVTTTNFADDTTTAKLPQLMHQLNNIKPMKWCFHSLDKIPHGPSDHIQGIQKLVTQDGKHYFVVSASNTVDGYNGLIIFIDCESKQVVNQHTVEGYGHIGGLQIHGSTLLVPLALEPSPGIDSPKAVRFYDVSNPAQPSIINEISVVASNSDPLRDAQAAGFVKTGNGFVVALVISSKEIAFINLDKNYRTTTNTGWYIINIHELTEQYQWPQNINLFNDGNNIYLVGLTSQNNNNFYELLQLRLNKTTDAVDGVTFIEQSALKTLKKKETEYWVITKEVPVDNMRAAGGIYWGSDTIEAISLGFGIVPGDNNIISINEVPLK